MGDADDFAALKTPASSVVAGSDAAVSKVSKGKGEKRTWLMAFETMPAQMLNVYGAATFPQLKDEEVWKHLNAPQKTGAVYMTEYCSKEVDRRGIANNRWQHSQLLFCKYQQDATVKEQNRFVLSPVVFKELYEEIDRILPSLEYCLAPKKTFEKKDGAASLRTAGVASMDVSQTVKDPAELDRHGAALYEWVKKDNPSRIRMLQNFQACGGLSFVASVHHRATQCFKYLGNAKHKTSDDHVSLLEFQESIRDRHRIGSSGVDEHVKDAIAVDYT